MKLKDILKIVEFDLEGIDLENPPDDLADKVKAHIGEKLIFKSVAHENPDIVKKIVGKRVGEIETFTKQRLKAFSDVIGKEVFGENDLKDKKFEEIVELGLTRIKDSVKEIKENSTKTDDKKLQKAQDDLDAKQADYKKLQGNYDTVAGERDTLTTSFDEFKVTTKRDVIKNQELAKIKFSENADPFWKKGFFADFDSKHRMELTDENELGYKVINTQTKETILEGSKPKEYHKIVEEEVKKAGKLQLNGPKKPKEKTIYTPPKGDEKDLTPGQMRAMENLERLKESAQA